MLQFFAVSFSRSLFLFLCPSFRLFASFIGCALRGERASGGRAGRGSERGARWEREGVGKRGEKRNFAGVGRGEPWCVSRVLPQPSLPCAFSLSHRINRTERIDASVPMEPNLTNTSTPLCLSLFWRIAGGRRRLVAAFYVPPPKRKANGLFPRQFSASSTKAERKRNESGTRAQP